MNRRYQRTATTITSAGNRNPAKADFAGSKVRGRLDSFTTQPCLDPAHDQRNSTDVLAELFAVSPRMIGNALIQVHPILQQHGWTPKPATQRFATAAALLASIEAHDTPH